MGMDTVCIHAAGTHTSSHICVHKDEEMWKCKVFYFGHQSCKYVTVKQVCMYIRKEGCAYVCVFIPHMKYTHLYVCSSALNFGRD